METLLVDTGLFVRGDCREVIDKSTPEKQDK